MSIAVINGNLDTGAVGFATALALIVDVTGHRGYLFLDLLCGPNPITGFKITKCATQGGVHQDWITDFTVATLDMPSNNIGSGSPPFAANALHDVKLDMDGIAEIGLVCISSSATSLRAMCGSIPR